MTKFNFWMSDYNHNYMFNVSLHFYFFEHSFDIKYGVS